MRIIAGESRGRKLKGVRRSGTRPTMDRVRESLFAILTPWMEDAAFLDLFAGSGSVGLEALSRSAARAVFVDSSRSCAAVIRENLAAMGREADAAVICRPWASALTQLTRADERFRIIFADPPYAVEQVLLQVAERVLSGAILEEDGWLILQHTTRLSLPDSLASGLQRRDSRRFGETVLTFYRMARDETADPGSRRGAA